MSSRSDTSTGDDHALEDAQQQHGGERDHRHAELETADPPHVAQSRGC